MADTREGARPAEGDWIAEDANPLGGYLWIRRGKGEEQGSPLPSSLVQQMRRLQEQAAHPLAARETCGTGRIYKWWRSENHQEKAKYL